MFVHVMFVTCLVLSDAIMSLAQPVSQCTSGNDESLFIADSTDRCIFYWCLAGRWIQETPFQCPPGTGVSAGYTGSRHPCSVENAKLCSQSSSSGKRLPDDSTITPDSVTWLAQDNQQLTGYSWKIPADLGGWTVVELKDDDDDTQTSREADDQYQQSIPWQQRFNDEDVVQLPPIWNDKNYDNSVYYAATAYLTPNSRVNGGVLVAAADSIQQCWKACVFNPTCRGFDFDTQRSDCFVHNDVTVCGRRVNQRGFNSYRLISCDAYNPSRRPPKVVESTPGYHIIGGLFQPGVSSAVACIKLCQTQSQLCAGVDFDTNGNTCWFHSAATECNQQMPLATSTHYRCSNVCDLNGYVVPGVHSLGGAYQPGIRDVMTCYRLCAVISNCVAIDFDSIDNSCWFHNSQSCQRTKVRRSALQIRKKKSCSN